MKNKLLNFLLATILVGTTSCATTYPTNGNEEVSKISSLPLEEPAQKKTRVRPPKKERVDELISELDHSIEKLDEIFESSGRMRVFRGEFNRIQNRLNDDYDYNDIEEKQITYIDDNQITRYVYSLLATISEEKCLECFLPLINEIREFEYYNVRLNLGYTFGGKMVKSLLDSEAYPDNSTVVGFYRYNPYTGETTDISESYPQFIGMSLDVFENKIPRDGFKFDDYDLQSFLREQERFEK
ncbi:MAG: hypothetical protein ABIH72_02560 [archaeon]